MSKIEALYLIGSQLIKADKAYHEHRANDNKKGMDEQKLVIQALLIAEDVIKEITEIWMFNPIKPNKWELVK